MTARPAALSTADIARSADPAQQAEQPVGIEAGVQRAAAAARADRPTPLFPEGEAGDFRHQWTDVQTSFVDEPRRAVQQADELVAGVMKLLADTFASERANLEAQWDRGDEATTEDLRVAMQRYRSFFDRLLAI